jgi:hypothetical protein
VELDYERLQREGDDARLVIDQLRGEISRVGTHLRSYAADRERLRQLLNDAEGRLSELNQIERLGRARLVLVRDLTHALHEPLRDGQLSLTIEARRVGVLIPASHAYHPESGALMPQARRHLDITAETVRRLPFSHVEIAETVPGLDAATRLNRLEQLKNVLVEAGARSERVVYRLFEEPIASPDPAQGGAESGTTDPSVLGAVADAPRPSAPPVDEPAVEPRVELWITVDADLLAKSGG